MLRNLFNYLVLEFCFVDGTSFDVITPGSMKDISHFLQIGSRVASCHYRFSPGLHHITIGWCYHIPDKAKWYDKALCWLYCNPYKWVDPYYDCGNPDSDSVLPF